ncbi:helix-turn-helix domain-containing protein, partial [Fusobacterium simiae]
MLEKYPDILKVPEISQILRIGIQKVYKLLKSGEIKNKKIGNLYFISKEDLIKYI